MGNFVSYENAEDLVKGIKHDIVKDLVNNKGEFDDSIAYKVGDVVQYYSDPQTKLYRRLYKFISDDYEKKWNQMTWPDLPSNCITEGKNVWTDGENIYYSNGSYQFVLDKNTLQWSPKTWNGYTSFSKKSNIWTDGEDFYISSGSTQYVLDKSTSTWNPKTWNGLTSFYAYDVWTDGDNIYYSSSSDQYVLDKATSTWSTKTWSGLTNFSAENKIWTDGDNIYYSSSSAHYVLDKATSTWNTKTWNIEHIEADKVWTDGKDIYLSLGSSGQYVLQNNSWVNKDWPDFNRIYGQNVWTDGDNVYFSYNPDQYILSPITTWNPSLVEEVTIEKLINDGDKGRPMTKREFDALSDEEKAGLIHVTDEPDNVDYIQISQTVTQDDTHAVSGDAVYNYVEIIIPPTITNYASYKNAGGNRGDDITKYWKDGSLADRIDGVNGFKPFEDLYLWDYIDLDSNITAPSSGGGSTTGTKRIHIGEFNGLNNYQLNKRTDNVNFFNHLRMVTGTHFGMSKMNDTNTTVGGYLSSTMHTDIIGDISTSGTLAKQLYDQLGSLLVPTTELLTNSINASGYNRFGTNSGCSNNWTWADVYARLLSEIESNGSIVWSSSGYDTGNAQHQLPAFKNDKSIAYPQGIYYWLKDVATSANFCNSLGNHGRAACHSASNVYCVRLLLTIGRKPS